MHSRYYRLEAIDLLNLNKGLGRRDTSSKEKDKSLLTCYNYSKQGHFARDCCQKNKVFQQLNILTSSRQNNNTNASKE